MWGLSFWKRDRLPAGPETEIPRVVAVVGPYRGGTSCVAGMVDFLGASMGRDPLGSNQYNPKGYFESASLRKVCIRSYREPKMTMRNRRPQRVRLLHAWAESRRHDGPVIGAKHPTLCLMLPEMVDAWPRLHLVVVVRPAEESIASLRRAGWWDPKSCEKMIPMLIARRDADLRGLNVPVLRLVYADVLRDPAAAVREIVTFADLNPTSEQIAAATAHVGAES